MGQLYRHTPGEVSPAAAQAVAGMRPAFVTAFRWTAGPGSGILAARAWEAWRQRLLALGGLGGAEESAYQAAVTELNTRPRYAVYLWLSQGRVRRATRRASAAAALVRAREGIEAKTSPCGEMRA
jgi:hypothetical protein